MCQEVIALQKVDSPGLVTAVGIAKNPVPEYSWIEVTIRKAVLIAQELGCLHFRQCR